VDDNRVTKVIDVNERPVFIQIRADDDSNLIVEVDKKIDEEMTTEVSNFISHWFDLNSDMAKINTLLSRHKILKDIVTSQLGLRLVRIHDLFEVLCWAIIGQQINLSFAYTVKRNLVEAYGERFILNQNEYFTFPKPADVLKISDEAFVAMKFSRQKIRYIRVVSEKIQGGHWRQEELANMSFDDCYAALTSAVGIGAWSANYVMMRCLGFQDAFPAGDAGLKIALKNITGTRPTTDELITESLVWSPYRSYAAFHLWRSLY